VQTKKIDIETCDLFGWRLRCPSWATVGSFRSSFLRRLSRQSALLKGGLMTHLSKFVIATILASLLASVSEASTRRQVQNAIQGCKIFLKMPPAKQRKVARQSGYTVAQSRWACRTLIANGVERTLRAEREAQESGTWSGSSNSSPSHSSTSSEPSHSSSPRDEHEGQTFQCHPNSGGIGTTCGWRDFECKPGPFGGTVCQ